MLRMADAEVLPLQFSAASRLHCRGISSELHQLADDKRKAAVELGKLLDENAFGLAADPTRRLLPPEREPEVPYLNFTPLDNVLERLKKSTKAYDDGHAAV